MYWFKKTKTYNIIAALALASAAFFHSCNATNDKDNPLHQRYTNLPEYFNNEITRLTSLNPEILKTVVKDSISESKNIFLEDWGRELSSFTSIDLNKPAYQGLFQKDSSDYTVNYTSKDPKIDIQHVKIVYNEDGTPRSVLIKRKIKNTLYETDEVLLYEGTKGYRIEKKQHIFVLGDKFYLIKGAFQNESLPAKTEK